MSKGIEIFLGYSCQLKCNFCFQKDLRYEYKNNLEKSKVESLIRDGFEKGKRFIIFSGGESTLDPNLKGYIKLCRDLGYEDIRVHTNGLSFSNNKIFKSYIDSGMTGTVISIHGFGPMHDKEVKLNGAFEKVKKTLINIYEHKRLDKNFCIDTNTVVTKKNYKDLKKLFKFLSYFPITRAQIVQLYSLYLYDENEKKELYLNYSDIDKELDNILSLGNINITLENFPFCKVNKRHWKSIEERQRYNNDAYGYIGEGLEESSTFYDKDCESCNMKDKCTGIPKDYRKVFPKEVFKI